MKTMFLIFEPNDVAKGDVEKFIGILEGGGKFAIDRKAPAADGSVKLYVTGPNDDIDAVIQSLLKGRRTVWLGQDPDTAGGHDA